jgi:hypothetical protein
MGGPPDLASSSGVLTLWQLGNGRPRVSLKAPGGLDGRGAHRRRGLAPWSQRRADAARRGSRPIGDKVPGGGRHLTQLRLAGPLPSWAEAIVFRGLSD